MDNPQPRRINLILAWLVVLMAALVLLTGGATAFLALRRALAPSASSERLAFVAGALGDGLGLYWADPEGNVRKPLSDDAGDALFPSWSPDGQSVLYSHGSVYSGSANAVPGVYLAHLNGTGQVKPELLYPADREVLRLPLWSPDGTQVALLPIAAPGDSGSSQGLAETSLVLIDMATRRTEERLLPLRVTGPAATWSADGSRLALVGEIILTANEAPVRGVYVYELASAMLTRIAPAASEVAWSPTAALLACANLGEQAGLAVLSADGREVRALESQASVTGLAWSPDGSQLVAGRFGDTGVDVILYEADTGEATTFVTGLAGAVQWVDWSPSGAYLAYTVLAVGTSESDVSARIEVVDMRTRQPVEFRAVELVEAMPAWRPVVKP